MELLTKYDKLVAYGAATLKGTKKGEIQVGPDGGKLSHEKMGRLLPARRPTSGRAEARSLIFRECQSRDCCNSTPLAEVMVSRSLVVRSPHDCGRYLLSSSHGLGSLQRPGRERLDAWGVAYEQGRASAWACGVYT